MSNTIKVLRDCKWSVHHAYGPILNLKKGDIIDLVSPALDELIKNGIIVKIGEPEEVDKPKPFKKYISNRKKGK